MTGTQTRPYPSCEKPLFVPLTRHWFEQFERGEKATEFRLYGARWNERTCRIGRPVTLSLGYGTKRRLTAVVSRFELVGPDADPAIREVYPSADLIAAVGIKVSAS